MPEKSVLLPSNILSQDLPTKMKAVLSPCTIPIVETCLFVLLRLGSTSTCQTFLVSDFLDGAVGGMNTTGFKSELLGLQWEDYKYNLESVKYTMDHRVNEN